VGMGNQNQINWRQVAHLQAWPPQALQDEQPARKVGIDENILPADLEEKTGVADESHTHLAVGNEFRLMSATGPRSDHRVPHQAAELPSPRAKRRILQSILQHQ
jgi:hypothetical protein